MLFCSCTLIVAAVNVSNDPTIAFTTITFTIALILVVKGSIGSRVYRNLSIDLLDTFFYWIIIILAVITWYFLDKWDSNQEAAAYISVITAPIALVLIVIYHMYAYTPVVSKFKGTKAGRMVDRLLTENETRRKTNQY